MPLQLIKHTFSGPNLKNLPVVVRRVNTSSPVRIYHDPQGLHLLSKIGRTHTNSDGGVVAWADAQSEYELSLYSSEAGVLLSKVIASAFVADDNDTFTEAEVLDLRQLLSGNNTFAQTFTSSESSIIEKAWNFGDASPRLLYITDPGTVIYKVSLIVLAAMNGTLPRLSVGTPTEPELLFSFNDSSPQETGTYETTPGKKFNAQAQIILTLDPSTSTQGNGIVILNRSALST